jgi:hypothetical protein
VIVVGGDSDYVGLVQMCRKLGRTVLGVGTTNANPRLIATFDEFRRYDELVDALATSERDEEGDDADHDEGWVLARARRRITGDRRGVKATVRSVLGRSDAPAEASAAAPDAGASPDEAPGGWSDDVDLMPPDVADGLVAPGEPADDGPHVLELERRLNTAGLKLPRNRRVLWRTPSVAVELYADRIIPSLPMFVSDVLSRLRSETDSSNGSGVSRLEVGLVKDLLYKSHAFVGKGGNKGYRLAWSDARELQEAMIRMVWAHLPDVGPGAMSALLTPDSPSKSDEDIVASVLASTNGSTPSPGPATPTPGQMR